jgi:hypothetical protein
MRWATFFRAFGLAKHLKKRRFLEHGHAQNLQVCVETGKGDKGTPYLITFMNRVRARAGKPS